MKKVLIVDDEQDILSSIKKILETEGFEAATANSAKKALEMIEKEKFDLVLMDIFMPKMSGREAVERIRANPKTKDQKVAFLTVAELSETGEKIIKKLKPVDYIQKPVLVKEFGKRIKNLV